MFFPHYSDRRHVKKAKSKSKTDTAENGSTYFPLYVILMLSTVTVINVICKKLHK